MCIQEITTFLKSVYPICANAAFIFLMGSLMVGSVCVAMQRATTRRDRYISVLLAIFPVALVIKKPVSRGEIVSEVMEWLASWTVLIVTCLVARQWDRNERARGTPRA